MPIFELDPNHRPDAIETVVLGLHSVYEYNDYRLDVTAETYFVHPDYDYHVVNDIALIRLSEPVTFNDYVRPICLATSSNETSDYSRCWIAGWGTTASGGM